MEETNLNSLKIDQLGYVYKDVKKQAKIMEELYGLQKFAILENVVHEVESLGKRSTIDLTIAFGRAFGVQIELIQWNSGDCIYKDFIDSGKEGLHHVSAFVKDLKPYIDFFKEKGFKMIHSGMIGKQRFVYFDTLDTFGIYLEFQETVRKRK